jgi:hypothetical protein
LTLQYRLHRPCNSGCIDRNNSCSYRNTSFIDRKTGCIDRHTGCIDRKSPAALTAWLLQATLTAAVFTALCFAALLLNGNLILVTHRQALSHFLRIPSLVLCPLSSILFNP